MRLRGLRKRRRCVRVVGTEYGRVGTHYKRRSPARKSVRLYNDQYLDLMDDSHSDGISWEKTLRGAAVCFFRSQYAVDGRVDVHCPQDAHSRVEGYQMTQIRNPGHVSDGLACFGGARVKP